MITGSKFSNISAVILLLIVCLPSVGLAEKSALSLPIEGLESTVLEEVAPGDYRILFEGQPLERMTGAEFPALRNLEIKIQNKNLREMQADRTINALLIAMARIADEPTLIYLHELYESYPERRNDVAEAISWYARENQRRDADWRILVRSLNMVEGEQAKAVMKTLTKFRRRSNKAQWIRQAILVGLKQDAEGQQLASDLLEHWTGKQLTQLSGEKQTPMLIWQNWFAETYPDELAATLPVEAKDSRWKFQELQSDLRKRSKKSFDLKLGEKAYVKATCVKCHRYGKLGEKVGPDLTHVSRRLQRKEIMQATIFPSHFVSEEYPTYTIITEAGKVLTGMMGAAGPDQIMLLTNEGTKQLINKDEVDEIIPVKKSSMPEGLLNLLTKEEAIQLFGYLTTLPEGASQAYRHTTR
ncbi:hypothetical protein Pan241w_34150 [Gimesia alba]|uniref:Cytochrome c domain-containing protein n=1 Tax=Gimesia alba TaxID=2527973 RepID=A0A517RHG7_9PLAN|nr:c-type cytochrome [Gimesia alba]QDT43315.1 hypothetical protein Pan241w_34150 [Gimesia alba]